GLQETGSLNGTVLAAGAMGAAVLVSYTRSKSEGLGFTSGSGMAAIGIMTREVRLVVLVLGLVLGQALGTNPILVALGAITLGSILTVVQRILHVRRQAGPATR